MSSTRTWTPTSSEVGGAQDPASVSFALSSAPRLPHHPRVAHLEVDGRLVVVRSARNGEDSASLFAVERDVNQVVAARTAAGNGPLTEAPLLVTDELMVHEDLGARWASRRATSLHERLAERWSTSSAHRCGAVLATLHSTPIPASTPTARGERPVLWPLTPRRYASTPDAALSVLRHLDAMVDSTVLHQVHDGQQGQPVLVHGDLKPDNVLLVPPAAPDDGRGPAMRLIDWELAGRGPAVTDIAALFAGVSLVAVQSLVGSSTDAAAYKRAVQEGSGRAVDYLAATLESYRQHRALDCDARSLVLTTAARLLARAQAVACLSGTVTALATLLTGLAAGLVKDLARSTRGLERALDLGPER